MTRPRRVLFVQTQAENAGAQEISRLLGAGLAARGHEVHHAFFYRASAGGADLDNAVLVCRERPSGALAFPRFLARLLSTIRRVKPDVVLTFQHYGNVLAAPAARLAGVPLVVANHVSARATVNGLVRRLDRALGLAGVYHAITVNSHDLMRDYAAYPPRYTRRLSLVPHGFQSKGSALAKAEARRRFALPEDARLVGCVSRLHPLKQLDHALALLPLDPGLHLALAGQGPDEARLRAAAARLGVADRAHFVGELGPAHIGDFLAALDAFVFPTAAETFGLAAVEAAEAGLPVVANDIPVLREVLETDGAPCALFVDTADAPAFAAAVRRALDDRALAATLSARGRRLGERHSLPAMVEAYARFVEAAPARA